MSFLSLDKSVIFAIRVIAPWSDQLLMNDSVSYVELSALIEQEVKQLIEILILVEYATQFSRKENCPDRNHPLICPLTNSEATHIRFMGRGHNF